MPRSPRAQSPLIAVLLGISTAVVLGVLTWFPHLLGLGAVSGIAHLQSFRALVTAALIVFLALLSLSFVIGRGVRFCAGFIAASLVFVAVSLGVLGLRGGTPQAQLPSVPGDLRVISANLFFGAGSLDDVLGPDARGAGVIALQETDRQTLIDALKQRGLNGNYRIAHRAVFDGEAGTVLAVHNSLQPEELADPEASRAFVGMRTTLGDMYAVHTHAPIQRSLLQQEWQRTVSAATGLCQPGTSVLVAGDFNATLDHAPFALPDGCADAARSLRMSGAGTWPAGWPGLLGAQIDHQVYDRAALHPIGGQILEISGSDHRGIVIDYHLPPETQT
ncbi:endonuclease/exonuclease/phosphatase family protein [Brevibacterium luteolum]|uniref:endonuclease/exonuclease/phosphatase family protein n=1 Tax=Brevibacterium luteolum TaxID=199591 RepID=UPI003B674605